MDRSTLVEALDLGDPRGDVAVEPLYVGKRVAVLAAQLAQQVAAGAHLLQPLADRR